ncbi:MAG: aminopeptidase [Oscillospiraceae bacterium]|nr:aminopeptidase [Oscillospiraceae bacterium]
MSEKKSKLFYKQKNIGLTISAEEKSLSDSYCEEYKSFLAVGKTERLATAEAIRLARARGFKEFSPDMELKPGDKIYCSNRGKALMLAIIGKKPLDQGANIAAAHIDSPRLDLKQSPLYEDSEIAFFKTHYYGGIRKYQWVTIPLELCGVVILADGSCVDVEIGSEPTDPVLYITDLLPHLASAQKNKKLGEAITGEQLNIIVGSLPVDEDGESDKVKLSVLKILNEKYRITEEDFLSAELEAVPAIKPRDVGLDRSLIGSYGHDDRVCAFAELKAILDTQDPEKTAVCILADKEEIGSMGVTGMQSMAFEHFMSELCDIQGVKLERCFANSFCLSADVTSAYDPNFPEVYEKRNNARINYGIALSKFTGSGGKSHSSDASAEIVGRVRRMFRNENVVWQMGELGKVDEGGGGTVAMFMANRNIDTIDAGVPVLSMHAPFEVVSKFDCYMTYKGVLAAYQDK